MKPVNDCPLCDGTGLVAGCYCSPCLIRAGVLDARETPSGWCIPYQPCEAEDQRRRLDASPVLLVTERQASEHLGPAHARELARAGMLGEPGSDPVVRALATLLRASYLDEAIIGSGTADVWRSIVASAREAYDNLRRERRRPDAQPAEHVRIIEALEVALVDVLEACRAGNIVGETKAGREALRALEKAAEEPVCGSSELVPLAQRIAKGRGKYPNGCTLLSLLDERGEVAHAVNKYEPEDRIRDELLDVAAVAMRLYFGEIDRGLEIDGLVQRRPPHVQCPCATCDQWRIDTREHDQRRAAAKGGGT